MARNLSSPAVILGLLRRTRLCKNCCDYKNMATIFISLMNQKHVFILDRLHPVRDTYIIIINYVVRVNTGICGLY